MKLSMRLIIMLLSVTAIITGCKSSPLEGMSKKELKAKAAECAANPTPSRTGAMICTNVKKECEIRSKKQGKKLC